MSKAVTRHIWTTHEKRIVEQYCIAYNDKHISEITTIIIREKELPDDLRYPQIYAQVDLMLRLLKGKKEKPAPEPIEEKDPPTKDDPVDRLKLNILVDAIINKAGGLMNDYPDKLWLNLWAINDAIRYIEPEKYAEKVKEFGGTPNIRRIKNNETTSEL